MEVIYKYICNDLKPFASDDILLLLSQISSFWEWDSFANRLPVSLWTKDIWDVWSGPLNTGLPWEWDFRGIFVKQMLPFKKKSQNLQLQTLSLTVQTRKTMIQQTV